MSVPDDPESIAEIRRILGEINEAWKTSNTGRLVEYFHENIVIVGPGYREFGTGRDACIESYREFAESTVILEYSESEPVIHTWGNTAVCTYSWSMKYRRSGKTSSEQGTDQFVFGREEKWEALYRAIFLDSEEQA